MSDIPNGNIAVWNNTLDDRLHADVAALTARVAALEVTVAEQAAHLARLDAGRGPRDESDAALVETIAASVGGRRFTARELLAHGRVDPRLAAAITATDTDTPRALGKLFQRLEGRPCNGLVLERADVSRDGLVWCVVRV